LTTGLVSTDELIISDAGVLKRMDISVLESYIVTNLGDNNIDVAQSSHGFAVGDIIRLTTTNNTYAKALADTAANAETVGVVIDVTDTNNFTYATSGEITVAGAVPNSTTAGDIVFLSTSSAGGTQTTEPSVADQISKPIAVISEANNKMILLPYRGEIISGGATNFAPVDATYLAISANGTLTGERVLTAGTGITLTDAGANGAATLSITDDSVTFAKMQNVAANSVLVRNASSSGDLAELALATTQILIGDGTGFTAAALSGEATMTNAGVVSIADNIIDEANLKVSNGPTNGQFLSAQSGNTGGLTWAAAGGDLSFGGDTFDSDKVIGSNNAYDFGFETAGVTRMDITDDGKVGIGTIVPTELLSVNGTGTGITGTTVSTFSTQQDFNPRRGVMLGYDSSGQIGIISATTSAAAADLAFWSYNSGWSEKMRLKANGEFTIKSGSNMTSVTKGVATVFVKMSGSGSVTQSTNVASVTKGATGVYTVNFTTNQSGDNTYAAVVSAAQAAGSQDNAGYHIYSASTAAFGAYHIVDGGTTTHVDLPNSVVIYGSLA